MELLRTTADLRRYRAAPFQGSTALVPTMGALHEGHLAHIRLACKAAGRVIVSVFVNPTQFNPSEDFAQYPRDLQADTHKCAGAGADAVFAPSVDTVYPPGIPDVSVNVPALTTDLEADARPGHFAGVCRVVLKLLNLVQPDLATFGQKDYQQLAVIRALVDDLHLPVNILEVPTVREPDGLAMSSRNAYLSAEQRPRAVGLVAALRHAQTLAAAGNTDPASLQAAMLAVLADHDLDAIDYAVIRHRRTLAPLPPGFAPDDAVALVAARLGKTRLLDNLPLGPTPPAPPAPSPAA